MYQQNTNLKGFKKNGTKALLNLTNGYKNICKSRKSSFYINVID